MSKTKRRTWAQIVRNASRRQPPHFTGDEHMLSGDWSTCAVGEHAPKAARLISRGAGTEPDPTIFYLGVGFCENVYADSPSAAAATLRLIRAAAKVAR